MNLITEEPGRNETESKAEVLQALEDKVKVWMENHLSKRKLWFSNDYLPAEEKNTEDDEKKTLMLRERVRGIKDSARIAIGLNLITEEGLPHFHRLLSKYLGDDSFWAKWVNLWTAEEDRHGNVLRDYARDSRLFNFSRLEQMQYVYVEKGFEPSWDKDPYKVFVYTTLQERATQISHRNTGRFIGKDEPLINGILGSIATDEAKHYTFYRNVFYEILKIDPNKALQSALDILPAIDMPGIKMPNFREMADVIRRTGIYGAWDYKYIVEEAIKFWKIELLGGLNETGRIAQDKIMSIPQRLEKVAQYLEKRTQQKSFSFDLIYGRILVMD